MEHKNKRTKETGGPQGQSTPRLKNSPDKPKSEAYRAGKEEKKQKPSKLDLNLGSNHSGNGNNRQAQTPHERQPSTLPSHNSGDPRPEEKCEEALDKSQYYANGKPKKQAKSPVSGNKPHTNRGQQATKWVVKSLTDEVSKLDGEKDALKEIIQDKKNEKSEAKAKSDKEHEQKLVESQRYDIPNIRIVRKPRVFDPVHYALGLATFTTWAVTLKKATHRRPLSQQIVSLAIGSCIGVACAAMGLLAKSWLTPLPYTKLLTQPEPRKMKLSEVIRMGYLRPQRKTLRKVVQEYLFGPGSYTDIRVIGQYTTKNPVDSRLVADRPCRVNMLPQTLSVVQIEDWRQTKTIVVQNEQVLALTIKNTHKAEGDFMAKVRTDNRNAGQFNLTPIERALVCSYTPQLAALMTEVLKINSNQLVPGSGGHLDF